MHNASSKVTHEGENAKKLSKTYMFDVMKTSGPLWHHLELSKWAEILYTLVFHYREQVTGVRLRKFIEIFFSI